MPTRLVPTDLLFAYPDPQTASSLEAASRGGVGSNSAPVPLVVLKPQMDLIRSMIMHKVSVETYGKSYIGIHSGREVKKERCRQETQPRIRSLRWSLSRTKGTVWAIERDRLILSDGVEACRLAKALGKSWVRVRMPPELCSKWDGRSAEALRAAVKRAGRKRFYNPILHADFRRARISRPDSVRLDRIRRVLGPFGEGLRGLDIGCNMGYMCHHFQRQGFDMTGIDFDHSHLEIAYALNETYDLSVRFLRYRFEDFDNDDQYDVVLALSVLYHIFGDSRMEPKAVAVKVGALTRHALFWESGDCPDKEVDLIRSNSGLTQYFSLGPTEGTGKRRELGVFLRPGSSLSKLLLLRYQAESWKGAS